MQFLDISARELDPDEQSDDKGNHMGKSELTAFFLLAKITLCKSEDFISDLHNEDVETEGDLPVRPPFSMEDEDVNRLVLVINKRTVHYNRSVRQAVEDDWHEDAGNTVVKAVNHAAYIGNPSNRVWLVQVRVSVIHVGI